MTLQKLREALLDLKSRVPVDHRHSGGPVACGPVSERCLIWRLAAEENVDVRAILEGPIYEPSACRAQILWTAVYRNDKRERWHVIIDEAVAGLDALIGTPAPTETKAAEVAEEPEVVGA